MNTTERFLKYVQFDTASDETSETCPSTEKQKLLGAALVEEMLALGMADARMDEHGYVYGSIPANVEDQPAIGLIAHMDTVSNVPVLPMNTRIIKNYDGGAVTLDCGDALDPEVFPVIKSAKGKDLIVTDGRTLLGADDKAGVAEILTLCEYVLTHPDFKHGKLCIGFTPDEEIGRGADLFDVAGFGADYAYTVDGGTLGGIEYENFNAASADVRVCGLSVHPGSAKGIMRNAARLAIEFDGMLPEGEVPELTCGYEGFYHLIGMSGDVENATLRYIIRDHDREKFEARKAFFLRITDFLNAKYGTGTFIPEVKDSYYNMREFIEKRMEIVERAKAAYTACGVESFVDPIRGGTDGAWLTYEGLLCPNLATGGMNGHGRFECIAVQDLEKMTEVLIALVKA